MNPEEYAIMYHVEDRHWWYQGMEQISRRLLEACCARSRPWRILDAGCGTGAASAGFLADYGRVTAFDLMAEALRFCRQRRLERLAQASVTALPFAGQSFDLVASFDVLCERSISDDRLPLNEFWRVLRPGGLLLLRLPALDWLRGEHDEAVHIARRYTRQQLHNRLQDAGFAVGRLAYANTFLLPFVLSKRWADRLLAVLRPASRPVSDLTLPTGPLNPVLRAILAAEARWVVRGSLPLGVSVFAVAQKAQAKERPA
ncbi:MAG: class I SAM-dependent methyltransferase [Chloroflexota bacterium]